MTQERTSIVPDFLPSRIISVHLYILQVTLLIATALKNPSPTLVVSTRDFLGQVSQLLAAGQQVTIRPKGCSMLPFIVGTRDLVTLAPLSGQPVVGQVVLALINSRHYVLHRIRSIDEQGILLQGDGNLYATERCTTNQLCGVMVSMKRDGRYIDTAAPDEQRRVTCWLRAPLQLRRVVLWCLRQWMRLKNYH